MFFSFSDAAAEFTNVHGVDGFDNSFFNLKTPSGLNKRVLNVLPQSVWDPVTSAGVAGEVSAVSGELIFSDDYAAAILKAFPEA